VEAFEKIRPGLALLSDLLLVAERASFTTEELRKLQQKLIGAVKPSAQIRRLNVFADMLDSRENLFVRIFGPPLLWTTHVTFAIEDWRRRYGHITRSWIEAISEIEALNSLATYSYEHPDDPFPELTEGEGEFCGVNLGHPLLPGCVRNSVSLDSHHALLIVSGSNMSGKSTFLRTIGINTVLALAGAPVRAQSLRLSHLSLATSLHIADSLQEGASHFSAEIARIRQIVEIAREQPPALFLIDEILQGTNSEDRRIGAEAILKRLLAMGAIGAITTHDLALTNIPGANAHFRDQIRDGRMSFDYILKPGVVEGSNALELMRLYGLI
jgi:DNA mismatch repair ATPase MutS